jgi:hypothetical protein
MAKVTAIVTATTTMKAASGGVEEGSKDVGSFGRKKKTAVNDDIPSDVARESPPSSLTTAESTATVSKAGPAGVVARGPRGVAASQTTEEGRQRAERTMRRRRGNTRRGRHG